MNDTVHQSRGAPALLDRVRSEYLEMPGLTLTPGEARRLWNMDESLCEQLLLALQDAGFLRRTWRNTFVMA